jgi:hypothetical protein
MLMVNTTIAELPDPRKLDRRLTAVHAKKTRWRGLAVRAMFVRPLSYHVVQIQHIFILPSQHDVPWDFAKYEIVREVEAES